MSQVNVNYDDRMVQGIDRIAAARNLNRPDLLRAIAGEAIEAHDAGRLAFQMADGPRIDGSINALAIQLREAVIELERAQRANQRHEKKLLDAWVGSEEVVVAAQERLATRVNDINRKSYQPFLNKLAEVYTAIDKLRDRLAEAQDAKLENIDKRLEAVRVEASAPRNQYNLVLGDSMPLRFVVIMSLMVSVVGTLVFLMLAGNMAWLGVPVAKRLVPTTELVCRVINDSYGVRDCAVPDEYRKGVVRPAKAGK
ncbi:MAG: hypothetical protein HOO94_03585 [Novosphingobium sp.]|nr:hypothetical protein [Novosphingobium sp.]